MDNPIQELKKLIAQRLPQLRATKLDEPIKDKEGDTWWLDIYTSVGHSVVQWKRGKQLGFTGPSDLGRVEYGDCKSAEYFDSPEDLLARLQRHA